MSTQKMNTFVYVMLLSVFFSSSVLAAGVSSNDAKDAIKQTEKFVIETERSPLEMAELVADRTIAGGYRPAWGWHYPSGVIFWGLLDFSKVSPDGEKYFNYVEDSFDTYIRNGQVRYSQVNDSMGLSFSELYQERPKPEYKDALKKICDYYYREQPRDIAGTICYKFNMPRAEIWIDALFFVCPLECDAAKLFDDPARVDWALGQIFQQTARLFDNEKHLYYQGWGWGDHRTQHSPGFWSRGNGWVAMTLVEVLERLPKEHPDYQKTLDLFKTFCAKIRDVQSDNGMWHQMLDMPDSYEETSGTAMFIYTFVRGYQHGWLGREYAEAAIQGFKGLNTKVDKDGNIYGTCVGTGPQDTIEIYLGRPTPVNDWHGIGPVILAASAVAEIDASM